MATKISRTFRNVDNNQLFFRLKQIIAVDSKNIIPFRSLSLAQYDL